MAKRPPAPRFAWGRRLWAMTVKELLQATRDVVMMVFIVYSFTLNVYLVGTAADLQRAGLAVHDLDQSPASRDLIYRFQPPRFLLQGETLSDKAGLRLLDQAQAMVTLEIPPHFQENLLRGRPATIQMQIDTSNSALGLLAAGYANQIVAAYNSAWRQRTLRGSIRQGPVLLDAHRVWYNPNLKSEWFGSLNKLLQMITALAVALPAAAMAREKERGTIEQLLVAPLTPFQIMFPKVLAMILLILTGTLVSFVAILVPVFHLPVRGSLALFFVLTAVYSFTTAGIGLVAATIARSMVQVSMLAMLIIAPMIFLSGALTPIESMPPWLRLLAILSPLHHYIDITYGILLKGSGVAILWPSILAMASLGGLMFGLGVWRFRQQFT